MVMFEKYAPKARRVIFFARLEVSELGAAAIETEHLILGLLHENESLLSGFLPPHISIDSIRKQVENNVVIYERIPTSVEVPLSDECKSVLTSAEEEAKRLAHPRVAPEHLLLGVLRESNSLAARILNENGVQFETVRGRLRSVVDE